MFTVGIIVPSWHYFSDPFKLQPLTELYFATIVDSRFEGKDVRVNVIDMRRIRCENRKTFDQMVLEIPEQDLYFSWIAKSADSMEIDTIVEKLRTQYSKSRYVAGGVHVDNFPKECENKYDAIILGPGEESIVKIINDCRNGTLETVYKDDWKKVIYNNYPFPRRHYLPEDAIVNTELFKMYGGIRGTSVMFSRGCDFRCIYCVYNVPDNIQMRSPKNIEAEINYLKTEYKLNGINLRDEICIPVNQKVAIPFMEAIGRMQVIWRGQTRVNTNREVIALARETGCVELALGVESASPHVLDIIKKKQSIQDIRKSIEICHSYGIKIKMCLILGLPGEPSNIVELTRKLINETKPDFVNISGFCPVPGSKIFDNPELYGIKDINSDWSRHAHLVFRFEDDEDFGLPFEFEDSNKWGKTFSRNEIIGNIKELQHYVRDRKMSY